MVENILVENILRLLEDRLDYSIKYYDEYYPQGNRIDNADETDNQSFEIGFYAGVTFAINTINQELERQRVESEMVGGE